MIGLHCLGGPGFSSRSVNYLLFCLISVPYLGPKLSTILTSKPEFIDQLALCLDRDMRLIRNWRHLASKLGVDADVIRRLEQ